MTSCCSQVEQDDDDGGAAAPTLTANEANWWLFLTNPMYLVIKLFAPVLLFNVQTKKKEVKEEEEEKAGSLQVMLIICPSSHTC